MNAKPMIFTAENIRAIRNGRKTMTRRLVTAQNSLLDGWPVVMKIWRQLDWSHAVIDSGPSPAGNPGPYFKVPCPARETVHRIYPKYHAGDLIWTRETHLVVGGPHCADPRVVYRATNDGPDAWVSPRWTPSIFMPRRFSRLTLRVSNVRVERVQDISAWDAMAEGLAREWDGTKYWYGETPDPRKAFAILIDSINGPRGYWWKDNYWVWIIEWDRVWEKNIDAVIKDLM